MSNNLTNLILSLHKIGIIKFGKFKLKSRVISPFYIDLRLLPSHPDLLRDVALAYCIVLNDFEYDQMAGVPYAAMPLVGAISFLNGKPWIYARKDVKSYGRQRLVEGDYKKGEKVIVIDDLITSGLSKFEIISPLEKAGLIIKDVVVLIDREQGGEEGLRKKGYKLSSILTFSQIMDVLLQNKKITKQRYQEVKKFLKSKDSKTK